MLKKGYVISSGWDGMFRKYERAEKKAKEIAKKRGWVVAIFWVEYKDKLLITKEKVAIVYWDGKVVKLK